MGIAGDQPGALDIWVRQFARGVTSRLTFDPAIEAWPIWSPGGDRVAYSSNRTGEFRTYLVPVGGAGGTDSLAHAAGGAEGPSDWSRDGRFIATMRLDPVMGWDVWVQPAAGEPATAPFLGTKFGERNAHFSPDGRWIAYSSDESGRPEIYVQPFPGPGRKWQVSAAGGRQPFWREDGKELFYRAPDQSIVAVPVEAGSTFEVGVPAFLFKAPLAVAGIVRNRWQPAADGQRFLLNVPMDGAGAARLAVIMNWTSALARK